MGKSIRRVVAVLAALAVSIGLATPALAITFCYDYVVYQVSCQNRNGGDADSVRRALKENGYGNKPFLSVPNASALLNKYSPQPGDVLILSGHVAIVNPKGKWSHYLQAYDKSGTPYLPEEITGFPNMHQDWTLEQLVGFTRISVEGYELKPYLHNPAEIWRNPQGFRNCPAKSESKAFSLTATSNEPRDDKYYKISPTAYVMKANAPGEPQVEFTLEGQAPKEASPGDTFSLKVRGTAQNARDRYGVVLRWYEDGSYMRTVMAASPEKLWIGMDFEKKQVTPSGTAEFKVKVPETQGKELQLRVEFGVDYNMETRWKGWLTFVYTRKR